MSKIGRKPIAIGDMQLEVKNNEIIYKGKKDSGKYILPESLKAEVVGKNLYLKVNEEVDDINRLWGLHRALLSNQLKGAQTGFDKQLRIVGLGFKAALTGTKLQLTLGYSHKIDYELPKLVTVVIDKTGQQLTFHSINKELLGQVCSDIRSMRPPEPYKGTGIQYVGEVIVRKAGKAKSA
jgi:large subunit ribosomal protein L6